ncbi:DUF255 domain-containing protein [Acetivibrio straminisolvens]|uniref:DUF255 domain-containing protein n=1 Tax=Acetivibrio straminisolvens TaxID=253314 RepID=UPI0034E1EF89
MPTNEQANRLIHEKSPYLLQHAYNPVNWFHGVMKPLKRLSQKISLSSCLLAIRRLL